MSDMTLKARLFGDDVSLSKSFHSAGKASDGLGSKLGSLGKIGLVGAVAGGAALAVGGVAALGAALVGGVKDAASYQQLAAKTAAVLKSTGNAAHQSVQGIQRRAGALESLSGVDEETIISGQNVLATFTKVQDRVGKGNDIFNQATTAALNMSTALGTDMQGSVIQLGKALNDPIKGVTALSRVGVSFTAQQKKQIRTLVDSGKTMEAQKLILKELNTEFGGAAAAAGKGFNGAWARAKDSIQDAFREIGTKLLPVLTKLADYIAEHAGPFIEGFTKKLGQIWARVAPGLKALGGWFTGTGIPAVQRFAGWIKNDLWPAIQKGYQTILPGIRQALKIVGDAFKGSGDKGKTFGDFMKTVGRVIVQYVIPILSSMIRTWLPLLATEWRVIIEVIKKAWQGFVTFKNVVTAQITFILRSFATLASGFAFLLRGLSHIPGFGWAADAAAKLENAARKARGLADAINRIPRTVFVNTYFTTHGEANPLSTSGGGNGVKGRASGGPVRAGVPYLVGENAPELFVPGANGRIYNASQITGGGGGVVAVNLYLDGSKVHESMLRLKRQRGGNLGLA